MRKPTFLAVTALGLASSIAPGQEPEPDCAVIEMTMTGAYAAWATAHEAGIARILRLIEGSAGLQGPAARRSGHAGVLELQIDRAGRYEVALSSPARVDLLRDGVAETSVAHRHGPACTPIRKIVTFRLDPGRYRVEISGSPDPDVQLLVAAAPDGDQ